MSGGILASYGKSLEEAWAHTSVWAGLNAAYVGVLTGSVNIMFLRVHN